MEKRSGTFLLKFDSYTNEPLQTENFAILLLLFLRFSFKYFLFEVAE